ncbi:hypothetical protein NIES4071_20610 [Calothrix sp. NIES-4071]|nr:hypothetical protein NIES4071_20610 [Calothrix sp. NIES-4071]BAZ56393.1 hypothetical protein NIES4105_20560 [Calothrix sp. NIES-4105]
MALAKVKGQRIETKTQKNKLIRQGTFIEDTLRVYRESIPFYIQVVNQHPLGINLNRDQMRKFYDELTLGNNAKYPFMYADMPRDLRWDVLATAVGHYRAWSTNYQKWVESEAKRKAKAEKKGKEFKPHKAPKLPTEVNDSPTYYKYSMYKDDSGYDLLLKVRVGNGWGWVKFSYFSYDYNEKDANGNSVWIKGCPTIVFKQDGTCWINWIYERYHIATGGVKAQQDKRVCAVDIDLDGDSICVLSVLEPDVNGEVREVARHFVKGHNSHVRRRKSELGRIAVKMKKTGVVGKGFARTRFERISRRENSEGYRISREIANFAHQHDCKVIVFEYLVNLRPQRGKYSRRSNQKRAYWLKSKVYQFTSHIARTSFNILATRVSPKDTSRYCAIKSEQMYRTDSEIRAQFAFQSPNNWDLSMEQEGSHPGKLAVSRSGYCVHSGLNAARNIGMKFYQRYNFKKLVLVRG